MHYPTQLIKKNIHFKRQRKNNCNLHAGFPLWPCVTAKAITRQDSIRFSLSHKVRQTDVAICVGVQSALAHLHSIINNKHKNNVSSFISSRWFADASLQGLWLFLPGEDILALYIPHLWVKKALGFDQMVCVTRMLQAGRLWSNIKGAWGETLGSTSEEVHSFKSHMWVNNKYTIEALFIQWGPNV